MLPFQIARDETGSWRALERRLLVERRVLGVFRAMVIVPIREDRFRPFGFLVVHLEPRRGRTFAVWPRKRWFAGAACRLRRIRGRRAISPRIAETLSSHLALGFGRR